MKKLVLSSDGAKVNTLYGDTFIRQNTNSFLVKNDKNTGERI